MLEGIYMIDQARTSRNASYDEITDLANDISGNQSILLEASELVNKVSLEEADKWVSARYPARNKL